MQMRQYRLSINAICPRCGDVSIEAYEVVLVVSENIPESYYFFVCPGCQKSVRKNAAAGAIGLLMSAGVKPQRMDAISPHEGEPVSYDDLLDFLTQTKDTDYLTDSLDSPGGV
jgi:hypothetical protein